jgi:hypothetical protein
VLNDDEKELLSLLQAGRDIFVPADYFEVVAKIIAQFDDTLSYRVHRAVASAPLRQQPTAKGVLELDLCADAPFAYLTFPDSLLASPAQQFEQVWQDISNAEKRYVQARIPMNSSAAIEHINRLKERGFIFLGLAPLFGRPDFADIFIMQWTAPHVVAKCPLPGETDSVAKLHGYPLNLTGDIVATMRRDRSSPEYKRYATLFHDY